MSDRLILKFGTLKGWNIESDAAVEAFNRYANSGTHAMGAMQQRDTDEQKQALCGLIDVIASSGGEIKNDWTGEIMDAEDAKKYVMEYRHKC